MGFAVASEAAARGARVTVVAGPTRLDPPRGVEIVRVRSAQDMHDAVLARASEMDAVIMAAAVADYTVPGGASPQKIAKDAPTLTLTLTRTPDILADLGRRRAGGSRPVLVGFAAETTDLVRRAREKLKVKQVDLIVANDVARRDAGFEVETNAATLVSDDGETPLPLQPKTTLARAIVDRIEALIAAHATQAVGQPAPKP
jgi:phosphopantothenoylcysteine decarboxylase/phosphopantothenate--cysteine ligase